MPFVLKTNGVFSHTYDKQKQCEFIISFFFFFQKHHVLGVHDTVQARTIFFDIIMFSAREFHSVHHSQQWHSILRNSAATLSPTRSLTAEVKISFAIFIKFSLIKSQISHRRFRPPNTRKNVLSFCGITFLEGKITFTVLVIK